MQEENASLKTKCTGYLSPARAPTPQQKSATHLVSTTVAARPKPLVAGGSTAFHDGREGGGITPQPSLESVDRDVNGEGAASESGVVVKASEAAGVGTRELSLKQLKARVVANTRGPVLSRVLRIGSCM